MEVVLNLLLVFYEAMKSSGRRWPVISEEVQVALIALLQLTITAVVPVSPG